MDEPDRSVMSDYLVDLLRKVEQSDRTCSSEGSICTQCQQGVLEYDGMLNLFCPYCGYRESGAST